MKMLYVALAALLILTGCTPAEPIQYKGITIEPGKKYTRQYLFANLGFAYRLHWFCESMNNDGYKHVDRETCKDAGSASLQMMPLEEHRKFKAEVKAAEEAAKTSRPKP
jgi:hypothetical protein